VAKIEPTMTIRVDCDDFKSAADRFADSFERFERAFYDRFAVPPALLGGEDVGALKGEIERLKREIVSLQNRPATLRKAYAEIDNLRRKLGEARGTATYTPTEPYDLLRKQRDAARARLEDAARLVVEFEPGMHGREFRERLANEIRKLKP
jgi:hypothetical protein